MSTVSTGKVRVYRREGIPIGTSKDDFRQSLPLDVRDHIKVTSLSPGLNVNQPTLTATFSSSAPPGEELLLSEDKDFYGFTPLYTPEGDIEADIIALTGLAGHAFGSWAASPHMWLRDFLPNDLPRARILLYGYDSNLAGSQSRNILADLSNNFVIKLHTMRSLSRSEDRPLILIGHSLGCLIIKDALTEITSFPVHHLAKTQPIVKAVIFFGAPHRGLNISVMQSILNGTPSAELIRELGRQSPTIERLNNGFGHLCEGLDILSIYEKRPTATLCKSESGGLERTGPLEMMVEKDSALLYLKNEISIGLELDHSKIAKVVRGQNGCYDDIVLFLRQSVSSASAPRESQQSYHELPPLISAPLTARNNLLGLQSLPTRCHDNLVPRAIHQEPPDSSKALKPLFLIPFGRDDSFVNRIEIFNDINKLSKQHRRVAISGIGGIGKSQIAIEYCYRFRDDHPQVQIFWVYASTKNRFVQAYKDIARRLELPGWNDPNIDTLRLVSDWFNEADSWLIVLDNADDLDMFFPKPVPIATNDERTLSLIDYLPHSKGLMLITTRNQTLAKRLAGVHALLVVNPMSPQEAQELLLEKWQATSPSNSDEEQSRRLVEALGYIPLAITQAAAFINENLSSLTEYMEMLRTSDFEMQQLLNQDLGDLRRDSQGHNSIVMTWKMSFDLISKQDPRAAEMLSRMAFLDRHGIPEILLRNPSDQNVDFKKALGTLQAFSLIRRKAVDRAEYELHRLVQLICQKWLEMQGTTAKWQITAFTVVASVFPTGSYETWTECESILPHALKVLEYGPIQAYPMPLSNLLSKVAFFDREQGRYQIACVRFSAASEMLKTSLGMENDITLRCLGYLGYAYSQQGRLEEAEKLQMQVLENSKRVLGVEHPDTLYSMNNLAVLYQEQHRWDLGKKLHTQVLEIRKRVLGAEHPDTLISMSNAAVIYSQQEKWDEAEKLLLPILEIQKRVLGLEHPNVLRTMNNLAGSSDSLGRCEEAETLYVRVQDVTQGVLGAEHPNTLCSMSNLAYTMSNLAITSADQDRWEKAEKIHLHVIEVSKRVLGTKHPDTLTRVKNLAYAYFKSWRWKEAETWYVQAVEVSKGVLGAEHLDTLACMNRLAVIYVRQKLWEEAETLCAQVLEGLQRVLGAEHPNTQQSMVNLAIIWYRQERQNEAIAMIENMIEIQRRTGADSPETFDAAAYLEMSSKELLEASV